MKLKLYQKSLLKLYSIDLIQSSPLLLSFKINIIPLGRPEALFSVWFSFAAAAFYPFQEMQFKL